jgi:UDP-N-acetyl-2-amino-2-deoxyglucuronate dehydrogenase
VIGVAVAGIGNAGSEHVRAFAVQPGAHVCGIVDADRPRALALCREVGLRCPVHATLDAALADGAVDAVVIATPNDSHASLAIAAARAGKHVLLEKPAAINAASLDATLEAVREAGVLCQVNMILRWHPMIESIVRLRDAEELGAVHTVEVDFVFGELEGAEPEWARTRAAGGSLHLYAGCHAYDQLEWLMGDRVSEIAVVSGRRSDRWEYDATAVVAARFARGGIGRATITLEAAAPYRFGVRVFGTRGTVVDNTVCIPAEHGTRFVEHSAQRVDVTYLPFERVAADFIENVAGGTRTSHASLDATARVFRLAIAAEASAAERRTVVP